MSVKRNYIYNLMYQVISIIIPIITIPYLSRILGKEGIGTNAFTLSITQYFIIFGTLGISIYGNRTIAYVRDDKEKLSKSFWSIVILQFITTSIAFISYFIFFSLYNSQYKSIYLLQSINLLAAVFDISWFFMGLEQFKKTVTRNLIVRITGLICIFIFVRDYNDLWKYVVINAAAAVGGQLIMWMYIPRSVDKVKISMTDIKQHLIPSIRLFIPQLATQIYVLLNKPMLGSLSSVSEVGYFENAEKMVKITLTFVTSIGTVMMPRVANVFAQKDYDKVQEYIEKSFKFVNYLAIPMMFGISAIAINFAPWFFGIKFQKSGELMIILSFLIPSIAWGTVFGIQYLLPVGKVNEFTIAAVMGAIVNLVLNLILIPLYQSSGASAASVAAEFTVALIQLYFMRKAIRIKNLFSDFWKYIVAGISMFVIVKFVNSILAMNVINLIIQVSLGGVIYFIVLILLKNEINSIVVNQLLKLQQKVFKFKRS